MQQDHPQIVFIYGGNPCHGAPHQVMAGLWMTRLGYNVLCIADGCEQQKTVNFPIGILRTHFISKSSTAWGKILWHLKLFAHLLPRRFGIYRNSLFYIQGNSATAASFLALYGLSRTRIVYHSQDFLEPKRHRVWEFFERRLARRAGHVVLNEPNRARFMASYYGLRKMPTVLPTALPLDWPWPYRDPNMRQRILDLVSTKPILKDARVLIHFGPLVSNRCGNQIAKALSLLPDNHILVITGAREGSTTHKETFKLLKDAGVENRSVIFPQMEYHELQDLGASCDVGLLLYPNDGIGNYYQAPGRLSEYLRAGLAIVIPNYPNLELLNCKLHLGSTCNPEDPESIYSAIFELTNQTPEKIKAQRERNITCASSKIFYEAESMKLELLIKEILGNSSMDPQKNKQ